MTEYTRHYTLDQIKDAMDAAYNSGEVIELLEALPPSADDLLCVHGAHVFPLDIGRCTECDRQLGRA